MSTTTPSQQQGHRAADAARLLQKAFLRDWENHLRNLGVTGPPDLAPAGALGEALRRSRAIESCRVVCSNCTEIIVALWEDQMKDNSSTINAGLIFDGILFATYLDRGRYIGTGTKNRARWLEKNAGKVVAPSGCSRKRRSAREARRRGQTCRNGCFYLACVQRSSRRLRDAGSCFFARR